MAQQRSKPESSLQVTPWVEVAACRRHDALAGTAWVHLSALGNPTMPGTLIEPKPFAQRGPARRPDVWRAIAVCSLLTVGVLLVYSRTLIQGFSNYDDSAYVWNEPHVSGGLSWSGVSWAFTKGPRGDWCPLAVLSHMLDCQLYGLNPAGHHLTNLLLHAASAVTLFLVLWRMTDELMPSAMVAALFAFHPLRVESVAWIAERRDVLSGFFFMLTLGAYCEYVRRSESLGRYLAVVALFALGLLAKSILVTVPLLLLLLDFWPLGRFGPAPPGTAARGTRQPTTVRSAPFPWRTIVDKLPLLALTLAAAGLTRLAHFDWSDPLTLPERLANAAISYVAYMGQFFVPVGLSPFYSHPEARRPGWQVAAAVALLLAITTAAVIGRRRYPYFFVGWFWYVLMLVPVLGVIPVGGHARADRYTYLSQIGLYMALVWGATQLFRARPARRWLLGVGSALALAALMACAWRQTGYWQDAKTLWGRALACDPKNVTVRCYLGAALEETDQDAAAAQYRQALELSPNERNIYRAVRAQAHNALGNLADRKGDTADAIAHYEQALKMYPDFAVGHVNLARQLAKNGNFDAAMVHLRRSLELTPDSAAVYGTLAVVQAQQGKTDEAIASFRQGLAIDPNLFMLHADLALLLARRDEFDEAIAHYRRVIEIEPGAFHTYFQIAQMLRKQGKMSEADKYEAQGKLAGRRVAESRNLRGTELAQQGRVDEAIVQFQAAVAAAPDFAQAHNNLADALAKKGNIDGAIQHYRSALIIDPNFAPAKQSLDRLMNH
jgi:protein O-mannosyl-transferase